MNDKLLKLLLVEDDMLTTLCETSLLTKSGYEVISVTSGEDAIDYIAHEHDIDLVLMDVDLGDGMSGIEAASLINSRFSVPLIFYTSHDELDSFLSGTEIKIFGYIPKNSNKTDVIEIIRDFLFLFKTEELSF